MEHIQLKFDNLLSKWKSLFITLKARRIKKETIAGFGDARAKQLLDEYWDILQFILNDIFAEMEKQNYDIETAVEIPSEIWESFKPKIKPLLDLYCSDLKNFLKEYSSDVSSLQPDIVKEIEATCETTIDDVLVSFNRILKEGY